MLTTIHNVWSESRSVVSDSLWPHGLYSPWNSPGQNTGVGCHTLLQGIFPTQGSSPGLPPCRRNLYHLSHQGSPWILEWVTYPFSKRSSWPRDRTSVSCIAGRFFTVWATREAHEYWSGWPIPSPGDFPDPGNQTKVSCIAGRLFTSWATREACYLHDSFKNSHSRNPI